MPHHPRRAKHIRFIHLVQNRVAYRRSRLRHPTRYAGIIDEHVEMIDPLSKCNSRGDHRFFARYVEYQQLHRREPLCF